MPKHKEEKDGFILWSIGRAIQKEARKRDRLADVRLDLNKRECTFRLRKKKNSL